jgi:hypothetical protein
LNCWNYSHVFTSSIHVCIYVFTCLCIDVLTFLHTHSKISVRMLVSNWTYSKGSMFPYLRSLDALSYVQVKLMVIPSMCRNTPLCFRVLFSVGIGIIFFAIIFNDLKELIRIFSDYVCFHLISVNCMLVSYYVQLYLHVSVY